MNSVYRASALATFLLCVVVIAACDPKSGSTSTSTGTTEETKVAKKDPHSGWWCDEHALPEDVCDLCSRKYRESEKKKGNWCEHDRVKTSCFKCTPEAREKYAKEYVARYGKQPPEPDPEEVPVKGQSKEKS